MFTRNQRQGFMLFGLYLLFYAGFVLLSAFAPETMESLPVGGINLAILYGFFLIILAVVLSLVYGLLCREKKGDAATADDGESEVRS